LQQAWDIVKLPEIAVTLGEVLLALALPESGDTTQWQAVTAFAAQLTLLPAFAAGLRAEVAIARQDYPTAKREAERALQADDPERTGFYLLSLGRSQMGMAQAEAAISSLEQAKTEVPPEVDPDLHIRILRSLHQAYTAAANYRQAFGVKCEREAVETQYGFRAFIGAGRLRPQRRIGAIGEEATEDIAASGRQSDIEALVERVKRSDCRLTIIHGPSGVGKSSLIQAGLVPALRQLIHQARSVVPLLVEHYEDWQGELAAKLGVAEIEISDVSDQSKTWSDRLITQLQENDRRSLITVLIFDQFEEFFFKHIDVSGRRQFYNFLRDCLDVPFVWVFLSLREDYVHYLLECDRLADLTLINNDILNKNLRYYLGNFSPERAKAVIRELTERSPYRLEQRLIDRWVSDLAADLAEVRPIELQVVGAQMLGDAQITTLAAYEALGAKPKQALVERWLTQVGQDCGQENEELAQRVLYALTEEPEKRPVKTKSDLQRDVRSSDGEDLRLGEVADLGVKGDLDFVLTVLVGSGLAFEIPATPVGYQLIHDYLVPPIRQQFGMTQQLEEERQKRKLAEKKVEDVLRDKLAESEKSNRRLRQVLIMTALFAVGAAIAGGVALWQKKIADENALNSSAVVDSLTWNELMDAEVFNLEEQVTVLEKAKNWQGKLSVLYSDNRLELLSTLNRAVHTLREKNRLEGHQDDVYDAAFSPDGKAIVTGSWDKTAKLWNVDGQLLHTFSVKSKVNGITFSPDGKTILTGSADNTGKLWSIDGRPLYTFQVNVGVGGVESVTFSPDGKTILTGGSFGSLVELWSIDGRFLRDFQGDNDVAFSSDGKTILIGSADNTDLSVKLWGIDGKLLQTFQAGIGQTAVAFSPDGKTILTGSADNIAKLWSINGKFLQAFQNRGFITGVAFSPDGKTILTGSGDRTAKLWSTNGKLLRTLYGHKTHLRRVAFSPDGKTILTTSGDRTAKLWSTDEVQTFHEHQDLVTSVAFSPDGKTILTGSKDDSVKLWGIDGKLLRTLRGHEGKVTSVAFSPNGRTILTGSEDNTAKLWSIDGKLLQVFQNKSVVTSVAFSPNGKAVLTSNANVFEKSTVALWSIDGKPLRIFDNQKYFVTSVAFSPDGKTILAGNKENTVDLWSLNGKLLHTFQGHQNEIYSVAFSPDGKTILTGSADRTAKLWSIDGRLLQTFQGHQSYVWSVAFSPDGKTILTGSADKTVKLWSIDGRLLQTFQGHQAYVYSVAFSPDGKTILSGSGDNAVRLWRFDLDESLSLMCNHLRGFAAGSSNPNLPEESRQLRERARHSCEGIPPPNLISRSTPPNGNPEKRSWLQETIGQLFHTVF